MDRHAIHIAGIRKPGTYVRVIIRGNQRLSVDSESDADFAAAALLASARSLLSLAFLSVRYHHATAQTATKHAAMNIIPI